MTVAINVLLDKEEFEGNASVKKAKKVNISKPSKTKEEIINTLLINTGKQIIIQSTNKIANHIGKSYEMRKVNDLIDIVGDGITAFSSPAGAIAITAKYSMQILESALAQQSANREWNLAWQRSGNAVLGRQ